MNDLVQEARIRWLRPAEVLFILENYQDHQLIDRPPQKPASGSVFLFNKRVLRFFRKDGHNWRKKKDGKTVGEAHERLKVGNVEALNCYYAHGDPNPNFQRRSYWMLDPAFEHIVLVHYRDITEGRDSGGSIFHLSPGSYSTVTQCPNLNTTQISRFIGRINDFQEPYQNTAGPGSVEVSSDVIIKSNTINHVDIVERSDIVDNLSELEIGQALCRLEEQLSLGDNRFEETGSFYYENEKSSDEAFIFHNQSSITSVGTQGENEEGYGQPVVDGFSSYKETAIWNEVQDSFNISTGVGSQEKPVYTSNANATPLPPSSMDLMKQQESSQWINFGGSNANNSSMFLSQEVEDFNLAYFPSIMTYGTNSDHHTTIFEHGQIGIPLEASSSLTVSHTQKYTIHELSPEWGYVHEATKVIIIGTFLCDPADFVWSCMFGDIEVPIQIIQQGVIRCQAPPNLPGKVTLCITAGNRESCSEVREFEYRVNPNSSEHSTLPEIEASNNSEELLLLVRFVQMLLFDSSVKQTESSKSEINMLYQIKASEDSWSQVIEALLIGAWTSSSTTDWLLQELLKDKLQQWLSSRLRERTDLQGCSLSKKEQGIIHMVAGLGFVWALNPILSSGVSVDFRDINGLTALHWAARFGREKMAAALIASGASAGAVTDPTSQDLTGETPASIAATHGHNGLAGYLSEVSLTSHLSNLKIAESELSRTIADVEAERTVNSISKTSPTSEDQLSLKETLAAVRNSAQAAARIQAAFRAHSFRKRRQKETNNFTTAIGDGDEFSVLSNDVQGLSAASKLIFCNTRDSNAAALSIQKKYRGWKGRKDFLAIRQKVVNIQAHVRGHQVRKNYKVICWAVGVLEKVVLRWHRGGIGLRGFRLEPESIDESEDEDILKVFRKQKVDAAIDQAVSRVLSMVKSPVAQQQYRRMLEKYREAKAELGSPSK